MTRTLRQIGRNYAYLYGISAKLPVIGWALSGAGTGCALPGSLFYNECKIIRQTVGSAS